MNTKTLFGILTITAVKHKLVSAARVLTQPMTTVPLLSITIVLLNGVAQAQDQFYATTGSNSHGDSNTLVEVNASTGAQAVVGSVGAAQNADLIALDPKTGVYYVGSYSGTMGQINVSTGQTTVPGSLGTQISSMAFSTNGTLYGVSDSLGIGTINLNNWAFTPVSSPSTNRYVTIAFSPDNTLYAIYENQQTGSFAQTLVSIDVNNFSIINSIPIGDYEVEQMTFSPDGTAIYFSNFSYALGLIDPLTGGQSIIGFGDIGDLSGIADVIVPQLAIVRSGTNVILTWTNTATGFTLQSTTNLSQAVWSTNLPSPVVINGLYTVTNPISGTQQFYQLSR